MAEGSDSQFLRLFPLQSVVLYPGMELPLVVFEPRYLQLTKECTDADEPFGVLLLRQGREVGDVEAQPFDVGTTAHILSAKDIGQGRLSVTAVGRRRFTVRSFNRELPYLAAQVEYLEEEAAEGVDPSLATGVREDSVALVRAMLALRGGFVREVSFPDDATELSFQVAQLFQGNARVQQRLLERGTSDRLRDELDLVKSAMERVAARRRREGPGRSFSAN